MIDEVYMIGFSTVSSVRRRFREFRCEEVDLGTICVALCRAACDRISAVECKTQSQL